MIEIGNLKLYWCCLTPFTSGDKITGGWVAEHFLGYSRLLPIWYSLLESWTDFNSKPTIQLIFAAYSCICHIMTYNGK